MKAVHDRCIIFGRTFGLLLKARKLHAQALQLLLGPGSLIARVYQFIPQTGERLSVKLGGERPLLGIGQLRLQRCCHLRGRLLRFRQLALHQTSICFSLGKLSLQMMPAPLQCGVLFTQLADQPCLRRALLNVH
ncbi:hypothetical protein [Pseudomonas shirazensis]|uniref:hypothetical protein n=1 Tax=Pseudomonas shirazensis TaxID=2745494 RepID=UPI003D29FAEB